MSDRPMIIEPAPKTMLDYSNGKITIRWEGNGLPVKKWWLSVGKTDGHWNIRNIEMERTEETIAVKDLPTTGQIYAQVGCTVPGKDDKGEPTKENEVILSDPVWWNCPKIAQH